MNVIILGPEGVSARRGHVVIVVYVQKRGRKLNIFYTAIAIPITQWECVWLNN